MPLSKTPLRIKNDLENEIIEIEGVKYSYQFFRAFGKEGKESLPMNKMFMVIDRKDGVIQIQRVCGEKVPDV